MKAQLLANRIFKHYLRSALIPIFTIELLLVLTYFAVNSWNTYQHQYALHSEVTQVLPFLAQQQAQTINRGFAQISRETAFFARRHADLESGPSDFQVQGTLPQFTRAANGIWYQANRRGGSSLYYPAATKLTPRERAVATHTAALDPLYRHMVRDLPNVVASYYNTADNMNRLYPYIPKVWEQYPDNLNMADYNFYYLADARHNPKRKVVWTGAYLDPAGQGWMMSAIAPVYLGDRLKGVVGLDVTIENIVKNLLNQQFPWKSAAFLVDDSGMILAMPDRVETLFGLKELKRHVYNDTIKKEQLKPQDYNLLRNSDPKLVEDFKKVLNTHGGIHSLRVKGNEVFVVQARIAETDWKLFLVAESKEVFQMVNAVSVKARQIGILVVGLMVLFYIAFYLYLQDRAKLMAETISHPIASLAEATSALGKTGNHMDVPLSGLAEIDQLTVNFNTLARDLEARSKELIETRVQAELRSKEAELAYAKGLYESASGYLHNIGNLTTRLGASLRDLDEIVQSTGQYPEVFKKIREPEGDKILDKFQHVVLDHVVPRLQGCFKELTQIRNNILQTIKHQQKAFLSERETLPPEEVNLSELLEQICQEFKEPLERASITLASEIEPGAVVQNHREQIYHGLVNIMKNALESIEAQGHIAITLQSEKGMNTRITITDTGKGIAPEHQANLLKAGFTTKANGHGLGLHSFAIFLAAHAGNIWLESDGVGAGAKVVVEVGNV